jgi:hypothetical protein
MTGVGSRSVKHSEIALIRYDLPRSLMPPFSPSSSHLDSQTSKPQAPVIRYRMILPSMPVGPLDLVSVSLAVRPVDPAVSIRSASLIVERRTQLNRVNSTPPPLPFPPPPTPPSTSRPSSSRGYAAPLQYLTLPSSNTHDFTVPTLLISPSSLSALSTDTPSNTLTRNASNTSLASTTPLLPQTPIDVNLKSIVTNVAGAQSSGPFVKDEKDLYRKTLTFQWPAAKSHHVWAMGETLQSELASVRFFLRVTVR